MLTISANINDNHLHIVFVEKKVSNNMSNHTSMDRTMIYWFFFINNMFLYCHQLKLTELFQMLLKQRYYKN